MANINFTLKELVNLMASRDDASFTNKLVKKKYELDTAESNSRKLYYRPIERYQNGFIRQEFNRDDLLLRAALLYNEAADLKKGGKRNHMIGEARSLERLAASDTWLSSFQLVSVKPRGFSFGFSDVVVSAGPQYILRRNESLYFAKLDSSPKGIPDRHARLLCQGMLFGALQSQQILPAENFIVLSIGPKLMKSYPFDAMALGEIQSACIRISECWRSLSRRAA